MRYDQFTVHFVKTIYHFVYFYSLMLIWVLATLTRGNKEHLLHCDKGCLVPIQPTSMFERCEYRQARCTYWTFWHCMYLCVCSPPPAPTVRHFPCVWMFHVLTYKLCWHWIICICVWILKTRTLKVCLIHFLEYRCGQGSWPEYSTGKGSVWWRQFKEAGPYAWSCDDVILRPPYFFNIFVSFPIMLCFSAVGSGAQSLLSSDPHFCLGVSASPSCCIVFASLAILFT